MHAIARRITDMDMEHHIVTSNARQTPKMAPWGQVSTEITGFSDPSHYQMQRLLGEEARRLDIATAGDEWPFSLPS